MNYGTVLNPNALWSYSVSYGRRRNRHLFVVSAAFEGCYGCRVAELVGSLMEKCVRIEAYACTVLPMKVSENVLKVIHIRGCKVRGKAT